MAEKTQYDRVKEITDQLESGIENLFNSGKYTQWLTTMSRFHDYSLNNTILIAMQKPDATLVAGYTSWQKQFGRQVNKGEKGIRILAPAPYKKKVEVDRTDPNTGEILLNADGSFQKEIQEIIKPAFRVVNVFDVSQTNGREIPSLGVDELTGDVAQFEIFFEALKRSCPVPIGFEEINSGAKGYYHQTNHRIAIQAGMSEVQTVKTAIHEMAHQKLHAIDQKIKTQDSEQKKLSRGGKEVEAESVAFTVCQHYGIDTSDYSFGYIAGWSQGKETPELKASLNTIRQAASEMITDIDGHMKELYAERGEKGETLEAEAQMQTDAAYRIGEQYLEIHEASDGSWDFTLYGQNYREIDGGQIGEAGAIDIRQAVNEIIDSYQLSGKSVTEMNLELLENLTALYDPALSDEQLRFMGQAVEEGFDPHAYWVGGKVMDLTAQSLSGEELTDIKYQVMVDSIPKMLFSAEQWHEIEAGIAEKADVSVYADPAFSAEQMSLLHGALNAEYQGYLTRENVLSVADPAKPVETMRQELKACQKANFAEKKNMQEVMEKYAQVGEKSRNVLHHQPDKKKSVLADLKKKQGQIAETETPGETQMKSKGKEMG